MSETLCCHVTGGGAAAPVPELPVVEAPKLSFCTCGCPDNVESLPWSLPTVGAIPNIELATLSLPSTESMLGIMGCSLLRPDPELGAVLPAGAVLDESPPAPVAGGSVMSV